MNPEKEVARLQELYPGKNIISIPPDNPSEIICEVDKVDHPTASCSVAIAVIDRSAPHFHRQTCERYEVLDGEIDVFIEGERGPLQKDDMVIIPPNKVHWAQGNAAWVKVVAIPAWSPKDHFLVDNENQYV